MWRYTRTEMADDDRSHRATRRLASIASHVATTDAASRPRVGVTRVSTSAAIDRRQIDSLDRWVEMAGKSFGPGAWVTVDQARVDAFADCTDDHQWIHRAGAVTTFGGPIAHGLLTASLLPALMDGVLPRMNGWVKQEINMGFNRLRFVSPVKVGARVRASAVVVSVRRLGKGAGNKGKDGTETIVSVTVSADDETSSGSKPAMTCEWVTRQYAK